MSTRTHICWHMAVLVIAAVAAFWRGWTGPMVYDDIHSIAENPTLGTLLPTAQQRALLRDSSVAGRPVVNFTLAINYALGGLDVLGYHLLNHAFHLISALLLYGVLRRIMRAGRVLVPDHAAFAAALLWVVHPLHTETVTYLIQRTELLMGLFYLLTLYASLRSWEAPWTPRDESANPTDLTPRTTRFVLAWQLVAILACAAGMGCKEVMVSAPIMVLLVDRAILSGSFRDALSRHARLYVGLALTWALLAYLIIPNPRSQSTGIGFVIPLWNNLLTQAQILTWYLRLVLIPWPLSIAYHWRIVWTISQAWPYGLLIVSLLMLTAWAFYRNRLAHLAGVWFFLILAPTSSIISIPTEVAAERRMYLPLAAVLALLVAMAVRFSQSVWFRRTGLAPRPVGWTLLAVLAVTAILVSDLRLGDYRDATTLWRREVQLDPDNPHALNGLATELINAGQFGEAEILLRRSLALHPRYQLALDNLGLILFQQGKYQEAIDLHEQALRIQPDMGKAYNNIGAALAKLGRPDEAQQNFLRALQLTPGLAPARLNLGMTYARQKRYDLAAQQYRLALGFLGVPAREASAHVNLALALMAMGRLDEAAKEIAAARRIMPDYLEADFAERKLQALHQRLEAAPK